MGVHAVFIAVVFRQHYVGMYVHIQYTTVTFKRSMFFLKLAESTIKYLTDLLLVGPEVESSFYTVVENATVNSYVLILLHPLDLFFQDKSPPSRTAELLK